MHGVVSNLVPGKYHLFAEPLSALNLNMKLMLGPLAAEVKPQMERSYPFNVPALPLQQCRRVILCG